MTSPGAVLTDWYEYRGAWKQQRGEVIEEALIAIYLNGAELVTMMASPHQQEHLALGFLKNEGLIQGLEEIEVLYTSQQGCCVDVWLNRPARQPRRVIITSGCGGGVTFDDPASGIQPVQSDLRITPEALRAAFNQLQNRESLYARARGVHSAGLLDAESKELLAVAEDVGRHNTIDKIVGACLENGINPAGKALLATGRVSSEMLRKAAHMGCPLIASRNSPTSMSIKMARAWNITLVGYVRRGGMRVYSHPQRLEHNKSLPQIGKGSNAYE